MRRIDQQPVWVLHRRLWRETSLLVELFSPDYGRLGLVARGARGTRSPWRGLIEPFSPLTVAWTQRGELGTLRAAEALGGRVGLTGSALWCGLYVNELLLVLTGRDEPLPNLYAVYTQILPALAEPGERAGALRRLELALLAELGVLPDLTRDAGSGGPIDPDALYDVRADAGLVRCEREGRATVPGRWALMLAGEVPADSASLAQARRLTRVLIDHQLAGRRLRTREMVERGGSGRPTRVINSGESS